MKKRIYVILHRVLVALFLLLALFPIYWMFNTSLKTDTEVFRMNPTMWPEKLTFDNYKAMATDPMFLNALKNSLLIALAVVAFSILVAFPAAYAIARIEFKGRKLYSKAVLFGYLLPSSLMYIPLYIVVSRVGLTNTIWGMMLIYPTLTLPYCCWVLIPHLRAIPKEIEEAAIIDGCTKWGALVRIAFPLSLNGIVTTMIFAFSLCWGEYLYALVNLTSTSVKTFPVVISDLIYGDLVPWGKIMAAGILSSLPVLILYTLSNSLLSADRGSGAVKG